MSLITSECSRCGIRPCSLFTNRFLRDKAHKWTHWSCLTWVSFVNCLLWWHLGDWLVSMSTTGTIHLRDLNKHYNCSNCCLLYNTCKTHRWCLGPPCSQWTLPHLHFHCTCWASAGDWLLKSPAGPPACLSGGTNQRSLEPPHDPVWPDECVLYLGRGWRICHRTDEEKWVAERRSE